ncbi:MAG: 3'-5' exonuclease [Bacteroidetes bacterium]|jgi:DNA polymerase-3 subunit alpha|nr:3'-5' exonuclease [Bacteroidota bacterium]
MYLVFDCSAAGKPKNWKAYPSDTFSWPRLIHLAWILFDKDYKKIESGNEIISPDNYELTPEIEKFSKVTQERAEKEGKPLEEVLENFSKIVDKAEVVFAHNLRFNENVVLAEFHRLNMPQRLEVSESYCIMMESTYFCKIPGKGGKLKWPTLTELHQRVFGKPYANPNDAFHDTIAAAKSLFVLIEADEIDVL